MSQGSTTTLLRDAYGVPHIFAETETDALYGFGYAQAEDRLEAILRHVKQARGELAEWDGPDALENDIRIRAFRLAERAQERYADLPAEVRAGVEAFCAGIARFQEEQAPERRPARAFTVTPQDIVTFALLVNLYFALDLLERKPVSEEGGLPPGSNAFAVATPRTASGRGCIVSLDPHLQLSGFQRWYEAHVCGGDMDIQGVTFAGLPYIVMGHNGRVAWANTVNNPDLSDLYEEELIWENSRPVAYEYDGERRPLEMRTFTFGIRDTDGVLGQVSRTIPYTHHGPVLLEAGGRAYSVKKAGLGDVGILVQARAQGLARDVEEFREALALRHVVMFNHIFGDATGRIGFVSAGQVPRRPEGFDFRAPVPGWTSATEWGEPVAFEELPQALDPTANFLQSANDGPTRTGADGDLLPYTAPGAYPEWLAPPIVTRRGERLRELLEAEERITPERAMEIATDRLDLCAARELPALLAAARKGATQLQEAIAILEEWDGRLSADAPGATLFQAWLLQPGIGDRLHVGGFLEESDLWRAPLAQRDPVGALRALVAAVATVQTLAGTLRTPWGAVHRHRRGTRDIPMDGGLDSLFPNGGYPDASGRIYARFGSSYRMIVELTGGDTAPRVWSCAPYGNSDDPASPHFTDQMPLAARGGYRCLPFTRAEVEAEATARRKL